MPKIELTYSQIHDLGELISIAQRTAAGDREFWENKSAITAGYYSHLIESGREIRKKLKEAKDSESVCISSDRGFQRKNHSKSAS